MKKYQRGFWGELVGAAAGFLGGRVGASSAESHAEQNAREQMNFQERMSNTAYQRSTQDMMSAGLNPMLAYQQGGASSPAGAQAPAANVDYTKSAASSALAVQEVMKSKAETHLAEAAAIKTAQEAETSAATAEQIKKTVERLELELKVLRSRMGNKMQGAGDKPAYEDVETARLQGDLAEQRARGQKYDVELAGAKLENRILEIEEILAKLRRPGAQNEADLERMLGPVGHGLRESLGSMGTLINSGVSAARMFRNPVGRSRR